MTQVMVKGQALSLRADGHLSNLDDWNEEVARELAKREGIELGADHWDIIQLMRNYYKQYNISPIRKLLKKEIAEKLDKSKASDEYLYSLFPHDVLVQGIRIAGIPTPMLDAELDPSNFLRKSPSVVKLFTNELDFHGKSIQVYPKGNLVNLDDWNEELAEFLAEKEGLQLTDEHWEVIHFLRKFYFQYGITPMVKLLMKHMRQQLGEVKSSKAYLYQLFPAGPARQGSRIAGLPEPQGCIDP